MISEYQIKKQDNFFKQNETYLNFIYKSEWKKIKQDLSILYLLIEKKVNIGILSKIIFTNINQKNITIFNKYNSKTEIKLKIEEIKKLKKYIIEN